MPSKIGAGLHERYSNALQSIADDCRDDPELRARVDEDPGSVFADRGLPFPEDTDVRVVHNTRGVFHLTMPPDPNVHLSDEMLVGVTGGSRSDPEPLGTASTASSLPSCLSTFGCSSAVLESGGR